MRLIATLLLLAPLLQDPAAHPLDAGTRAVDAALLKEILGHLASDELEGRCAGFPGNDKATEYIAKRFADAGLAPAGDPDAAGKKTYFQHFAIRRGELKTRNCAGLIEGSDPALKDQVIVVGAHHDHVGVQGQQRAGQLGQSTETDKIWNGADDNGSGTTALLGVVKAFGAVKARPRRSILFLTFSAEEWGLLGSRHYVQNPLVPLERTAAMLNMDMVGRTDTEFMASCYGLDTVEGDLFRPLLDAAAKRHGLAWATKDGSFGDGSDHISFFAKGVAVVGISEKGPCPDYHKVSDSVEKIAFPTMERIARVAATFTWDLADLEGPVKRSATFKRPAAKESGKPRLGAYLEAVEGESLKALGLGEGKGAMSINGFVENSVAETQGLKEGDIVVTFNGEGFGAERPREKLSENLSKVVRGEAVAIEVLRDGKRLELKLTWPPTERDAKATELIAAWLKGKDDKVLGELAALGDEVEPRAARIAGDDGRTLLGAVAIQRSAGDFKGVTLRSEDGKTEWKILAARLREEGEPLEISMRNRRTVVQRDHRLSIRSFSIDGQPVIPDPGIPTGLAPEVLVAIASAQPPLFEGPSFLVPGKRVRIEDTGREEVAPKTTLRKFSWIEEGRKPYAIYLDDSGAVVRVDGPEGLLR